MKLTDTTAYTSSSETSCCTRTPIYIFLSNIKLSQDIPEGVNDGLWITGQTEKFNTRGTKGKQGLNHLYVVVMTDYKGKANTLACCKIKSKLR